MGFCGGGPLGIASRVVLGLVGASKVPLASVRGSGADMTGLGN